MLHREIKALQSRLGISYKDAAHRLYVGEIDKLKNKKVTEINCKKIQEQLEDIIHNGMKDRIADINKEIVESYSLSLNIK